MGMFDWIATEGAKCSNCKASLDGKLQSKDGKCLLETLPFYEVNNFYAPCESCGTWNEFNRAADRPPIPFSFYKQSGKSLDKP